MHVPPQYNVYYKAAFAGAKGVLLGTPVRGRIRMRHINLFFPSEFESYAAKTDLN